MPSRRGTVTCAFDSTEILSAMLEIALADGRTKKAFAEAGGMGGADLQKYLKPDGSKMSTATLARVATGNGFDLAVLVTRAKATR
jgi:hypothetical protein